MAVRDQEFLREVCSAYGLCAPRSARRIGNGANLVWRLEAAAGVQVIKELPVSTVPELERAAEFERAVFEAGVVPMAEPIPDRHGRLARPMLGSRGEPVVVRLHRYVPGAEPQRPVDGSVVRAAGRSLARIQGFGESYGDSLPRKLLWMRPDRATYDGLAHRRPELIKDGWAVLTEAEQLVAEWRRESGVEISSHCDHKPENSLRHGQMLIMLDWDEAGACDPRVEAVEAAARWAWAGDGGPAADLFAAFVAGYRDEGRDFDRLRPADWAKWVAGIASWYEFKAQRAQGRWAAVASDHNEEGEAAAQTLGWLQRTLRQVPAWTSMINQRLSRASGRGRPSAR